MSYSVPWSCDKEDGTARWLALALFRVAWTRLMGQPTCTGHASLALQTRPSDDGRVPTPQARDAGCRGGKADPDFVGPGFIRCIVIFRTLPYPPTYLTEHLTPTTSIPFVYVWTTLDELSIRIFITTCSSTDAEPLQAPPRAS